MSERRIATRHTMVSDWAPLCTCGEEAEAFIQIHRVGRCTPDDPTRSKLLCRKCLRRDLNRVINSILGGARCGKCGLQFVNLSDIVVRLSPLWSTGGKP